MNIVHLVDYFHPAMGYQENHLANRQHKLGHSVTVITGQSLTPWQPEPDASFLEMIQEGDAKLHNKGIQVIRLPACLEYSHRLLLKNLKNTLKQVKPDLVHVHGFFTLNAILASLFKDSIGYSLLVDDHMLFQGGSNRFANFVNPLFKWSLARFIHKKANRIIAVSAETKDYMVKIYGIPSNTIEIIPLGVNRDVFKVSREKASITKKKYRLSGETSFIYTGKLNASKNPLLALQRALPLWQDGHAFQFILVGQGEANYLKKMNGWISDNHVEDRVRIIPQVANAELAGFFNYAYMAVWPCESSMSSLEAMACACPVILSNSDANRERTQNGSGFLFDGSKPEELTLKMKEALENPEFKDQMGQCGILHTNSLDWSTITEKFIGDH